MCEKNLTEKTLADVQAGIPARDAEIEVMRKENAELREQLEAVGAGGVNGRLMPGAASAEPLVARDLLRRAKMVLQLVDKDKGSTICTGGLISDISTYLAAPVAAQAQPLPDSLIPAAPDLEYLRSLADSTALPAFLRGQIAAAVKALEDQAQQPVSGADGRRDPDGYVLIEVETGKPHGITYFYGADGCKDHADHAANKSNGEYKVAPVFIGSHEPDPLPDATKMVPGDQFRDAAQMIEPSGNSGELDERKVFESWVQKRDGFPYARQFMNLMWESWQARAAIEVARKEQA